MIDSSKKQQQQSFPGILPFEDIESLKGKECLDPDIPKCLKEGQFWGDEEGKYSALNTALFLRGGTYR